MCVQMHIAMIWWHDRATQGLILAGASGDPVRAHGGDLIHHIYSGSRVNGKGQERPAATRQKRPRSAQEAAATTRIVKKKRVHFHEDREGSESTCLSSDRAPQQLHLNSRATAHHTAHGKELTANADASDPAEQRCDVYAATTSKHLHTAHCQTAAEANAGASTSSAAKEKVPATFKHNSASVHLPRTLATGKTNTAQEPSIAVSTQGAGHTASSAAHAQDPAGEGFKTARDQLPATRTRAAAPAPDPRAHDPTGSCHTNQPEPIAARTRSAHRAPTVTASKGKRKQHAAITVDAEEQCQGAKRARAGSASTDTQARESAARQPGKVASRERTTGKPPKSQRKQPARAFPDVTKSAQLECARLSASNIQ